MYVALCIGPALLQLFCTGGGCGAQTVETGSKETRRRAPQNKKTPQRASKKTSQHANKKQTRLWGFRGGLVCFVCVLVVLPPVAVKRGCEVGATLCFLYGCYCFLYCFYCFLYGFYCCFIWCLLFLLFLLFFIWSLLVFIWFLGFRLII